MEQISALCSTCKLNPPREGQRNCLQCHSMYMKDYMRRHRDSRKKMEQRQWFQRGATALREMLVRHFTNLARGEMNGLTAAELTRQCPEPQFPDSP